MNSEALLPVSIGEVPADSPVAWAAGMRFHLSQTVLGRLGLLKQLDHDGNLDLAADLADIGSEDVWDLRTRAAFTESKPVSSRFPVSYHWVPGQLRSLVAGIIGRYRRRHPQRWARFPGWPLDLSADFLADLAGHGSSPFRKGPTPVLLSHDLDSAEGLKNAVTKFVDLEEEVGARSSNYIVPHGWPIDHELLGELKERGHEIGIHGYDHSNRTAFCESDRQNTRLGAARDLIARYGMVGYRSPSLLRTRSLLGALSTLYRYDSSIPTSGGLFPVPNNGCASARPFLIEGIAEIPLSLPRDGSLKALGYSPTEYVQFWIQCAEEISRSGGVVVLLTHCEARFSGNPVAIDAYRRFLEHVASSNRYLWSTPREVLDSTLGMTETDRGN